MAPCKNLLGFISRKPPASPTQTLPDQAGKDCEEATAAGVSGSPSSGKKRGRPCRRCVRPLPLDLDDDGIDAEDEERDEVGERGSGCRKGKKTPRKTTPPPSKRNRRKDIADKGTGDSHAAIGSQGNDCSALSPEKTGSDFFVKLSEKRNRRKNLLQELRGTKSTGEQQPEKNKCKECQFTVPESNSLVESSKGNHIHSNYSSPVKTIDLRSEAKKAAEENARLFAGKQIHPFFGTWQPSKRLLGANHLDGECVSFSEEDAIMPCVPLHVLQITPDEASMHLEDWMLAEGDVLKRAIPIITEYTTLPSFSDSRPLKLDSFYGAPDSSKSMFSEPLLDRRESGLTASTSSSLLIHHQSPTIQLEALGQSSVGTRENLLSRELHKKRIAPYYLRCSSCQPDLNLWIDKYQPVSASEVCGNSVSVYFIKEWLHSWCIQNHEDNKESFGQSQYPVDDGDCDWVGDDDILINMKGDALKNLLLLTGPVGSGKSAAIYACAKEQGFQVIEVSASDWRSGTLVRQKFQEAMESQCLKKWSRDDPAGSQTKHATEVFLTETKSAEETIAESILRSSCNVIQDRYIGDQSGMKTLILFEDFDTIFDEDRGLLKTILDLAETAKRPIILTSNSRDPPLPSGMDLLMVRFTLPSMDELVSHVKMVCVSEAINISSHLIEHVIECCQYDIRKTLMFLQFWCQDKTDQGVNKSLCVYGSLPFDIDAGHHVIPNLAPWGFPSKLSEHIDQEISKSLVKMETTTWLADETISEDPITGENIDVLVEHQNQDTDMHQEGNLSKGNWPMEDCGLELSLLSDDVSRSKCVDTTRQSRHMRRVVLSDSEDEPCTDKPDISEKHQYLVENSMLDETSNSFPVHVSPKVDDSDDPGMELDLLRGLKVNEDPFIHHSNGSPVTSCLPEVPFVAETKVDNFGDLEQTSFSCFLDTMQCDYLDSANVMNLRAKSINHAKTDEELDRVSETMFGSTCDMAAESVLGFDDSHLEAPPSILRVCPLIDECSRADFSLGFMTKRSLRYPVVTDLVQQTWEELRSQGAQIESCIETEQDACSSLKIASKLTELISDADVILSAGHMLANDLPQASVWPLVEQDRRYDSNQHLDLMSTFAEHGLCFYAKECTALRRRLGPAVNFDLAWEMLSSGRDGLAVGKLIIQKSSINSYSGQKHVEKPTRGMPSDRIERNLLLSNAILSVVPKPAYLASKGAAFHEYLSFLSQISKSESARLAQADNSRRFGRRRGSRHHYLMTGAFPISAEDIILLDQHACYKKEVSKSVG